MLRLNPTRLRRFLTCEYDWFCYAVLGIEPRAPRGGAGRDRGKAMHALLEHAVREYARTGYVFDFAGQVGYDAAEQIYQELYEDEGLSLDEDDAHSLLAAIRYHVPRLNLPQWEVLYVNGEPAIEVDLRAPVPGNPDVELQAIIDVVFRHRETGKIWFIDWKTTFLSIDGANLRPRCENNYQLEIGRLVLAHHGVHVDISALVHLRSVAPEPPAITTRGKVSRNKANLACDWPTYKKAVEDNGEDPNDPGHVAVYEHLLTATFDRWRVDITSDHGRANMQRQIYAAAERMDLLATGRVQALRNLRDTNGRGYRGCDACEYHTWCSAGMRTATGDHDASLLGVDYKTKPGSPLKIVYDNAKPYDPDADYLRFAAERGQTLEPHEEFRP